MTIDRSTLASIHCANRKVDCPVCGRRFMSQSYMPFKHSGIGAHIRTKHPELEAEVYSAIRQIEQEEQQRKAREEKEAQARPLRTFTVTGKFLDEVRAEISSFINLMDDSYFSPTCSADAKRLIDCIEAMHDQAREVEAAQ